MDKKNKINVKIQHYEVSKQNYIAFLLKSLYLSGPWISVLFIEIVANRYQILWLKARNSISVGAGGAYNLSAISVKNK